MTKPELDKFEGDSVSSIVIIERQIMELKKRFELADIGIDGITYLSSIATNSLNNLKVKVSDAVQEAKDEIDRKERDKKKLNDAQKKS
jgi:hypothetical protein